MGINLNIVSFLGLPLNATVASVGGLTPPASTLVSDLPNLNPLFFIGYDDQGNQVLCCVKTVESNLAIVSGALSYLATTAPDTVCWGILIGGHPIHRPS